MVTGFNTIVDYLKNSSLPFINKDWFQLDQWGERISTFLVDGRDTITSYAADIGAQVGHFLAGFAITLFALFYFLYDGRGIWSFLLKFFPRVLPHPSRQRHPEGLDRVPHAASGPPSWSPSRDAIGVLIVALILGVRWRRHSRRWS